MLVASNGDMRRKTCPAGAGADGPETSLVFIKRHKKGFCRGIRITEGSRCSWLAARQGTALAGNAAMRWVIAAPANSSRIPGRPGAARRPRGSPFSCYLRSHARQSSLPLAGLGCCAVPLLRRGWAPRENAAQQPSWLPWSLKLLPAQGGRGAGCGAKGGWQTMVLAAFC